VLSTVTNPSNNPIIPNVQVEAVFYGSAWNTDAGFFLQTNYYELQQEMTDLGNFFNTITNTPYMDGLGQYTGSNGTPGRGKYLGSYVDPTKLSLDTTANPLPSQLPLLSEDNIQTMLKNDIASGSLPKPDANKLYFVFLPPGTEAAGDTAYNAQNVLYLQNGGHHRSFSDGALGNVNYAVIDHPLNYNPDPSRTNLQYLTSVSSHELVESVTDPQLNSWMNWQASGKPEIGDIAATREGTGVSGLDYGYYVTKYWSEHDQTDIPNISFQTISQIPYIFHGGTQFTLDSVKNGVTTINTLEFAYQDQNAASTDFTGDTFTGEWNGQNVHGTLFRSGTFVEVSVIRDSDGANVFTGNVSSVDGSWSTTSLEIAGLTSQSNGYPIFAFGLANVYYDTYGGGGGGGGGGGLPGGAVPYIVQHQVHPYVPM
jgi:hypothetical protein